MIDLNALKALTLLAASLIDEGHADEEIIGLLKTQLVELRSDLAERRRTDVTASATVCAVDMLGIKIQ